MDEFTDCPACGGESYRDEFVEQGGCCPSCGHYHHELDLGRRHAAQTSVGEGGAEMADLVSPPQAGTVATSIPGAITKAIWNGSTMTGQESTPAFNPGPSTAGSSAMTNRTSAQATLRIAAAQFADEQNLTDSGELAFRAARHVDALTARWPRNAADAARQLFVAAVIDQAPRPIRRSRTASAPAVLADFDDQLLFDS
jgi:hypothetical protein